MINISNLLIFTTETYNKELIEKINQIRSNISISTQNNFSTNNTSFNTNNIKEKQVKEFCILFANKLSLVLNSKNAQALQSLIFEVSNSFYDQIKPKEWPSLDNKSYEKLHKHVKFYYDLVKHHINLKSKKLNFESLKTIFNFYNEYLNLLIDNKLIDFILTPNIIYFTLSDLNIVYSKIILFDNTNSNLALIKAQSSFNNNSLRKDSVLSNSNNHAISTGIRKESNLADLNANNSSDINDIINQYWDLLESLKEGEVTLTNFKDLSSLDKNDNDINNNNLNILTFYSSLFKAKLSEVQREYENSGSEKALEMLLNESDNFENLIRNTEYYSEYVKDKCVILYLDLLISRIILSFFKNKLVFSNNEFLLKTLSELKEAWDVIRCVSTFYCSNKKSAENELIFNIFKPTIQSLIVFSLVCLGNSLYNVRINLILKRVEVKNSDDLKYSNNIIKSLTELKFPFISNVCPFLHEEFIKLGIKRSQENIEDSVDNVLNQEIKAFNIFKN